MFDKWCGFFQRNVFADASDKRIHNNLAMSLYCLLTPTTVAVVKRLAAFVCLCVSVRTITQQELSYRKQIARQLHKH